MEVNITFREAVEVSPVVRLGSIRSNLVTPCNHWRVCEGAPPIAYACHPVALPSNAGSIPRPVEVDIAEPISTRRGR